MGMAQAPVQSTAPNSKQILRFFSSHAKLCAVKIWEGDANGTVKLPRPLGSFSHRDFLSLGFISPSSLALTRLPLYLTKVCLAGLSLITVIPLTENFLALFHWPFSHRDFSCWGVFLSPGIKKTQPSETNSCERNPGGRWPSDKRQPSKRHPSGTKSKAQPVRENPVRGSPVRERPVRERSHRPWQFDGSVSRFSRHLPRFSPPYAFCA